MRSFLYLIFLLKYTSASIYGSINVKKELINMTDRVFRIFSNYKPSLKYEIEDRCLRLSDIHNTVEYCELDRVKNKFVKEFILRDRTKELWDVHDIHGDIIRESVLNFVFEGSVVKSLDFFIYNTVLLVSGLNSKKDAEKVDLEEMMVEKYYGLLIKEIKMFFEISDKFHSILRTSVRTVRIKPMHQFVFYGDKDPDQLVYQSEKNEKKRKSLNQIIKRKRERNARNKNTDDEEDDDDEYDN